MENTLTSGRDQDHLKILHLSFPDLIPDRTDALLKGYPEKPAAGMADILTAGEKTGLSLDMKGISGIPCNTFHARAIWDPFSDLLRERGSTLVVLNMIDETLDFLSRYYPSVERIGIISTTGTRCMNIYRNPIEETGCSVLEPENQEAVHCSIYNPSWGIKSGMKSPRANESLLNFAHELLDRGAELIVMGCTEIPLVLNKEVFPDIPLIDPMEVLARALIRRVDPSRLK